MPRLSIIVASGGCWQRLENTLVSVLENRPRDIEILVAHAGDYEDPHQLGDEVRFVIVPSHGLPGLVNAAVSESRSRFVHLLAAGATVTDGWAEPALQAFDDPRVAAVAPLIVRAGHCERVLAAGLARTTWAARSPFAAGKYKHQIARGTKILGPTGAAAFYRTSALRLLAPAIDPWLGEIHSDVDLGLRLAAAGYLATLVPESVVAIDRLPAEHAFAAGRHAERCFRKHLARLKADNLWSHALFVAGEVGQGLVRPTRMMRLMGRMAAWWDRLPGAQDGKVDRRGPVPPVTVPQRRVATIRIDGPHVMRPPAMVVAAQRSRAA